MSDEIYPTVTDVETETEQRRVALWLIGAFLGGALVVNGFVAQKFFPNSRGVDDISAGELLALDAHVVEPAGVICIGVGDIEHSLDTLTASDIQFGGAGVALCGLVTFGDG